MTFSIIQGDLFDPAHKFNALAQGVNTRGIMGSGIAVDFREKFPDMYEDYMDECSKYSSVLPGLMHQWYDEKGTGGCYPDNPAVYNLFSQIHPGMGNASMELLERATYLMLLEAEDALTVFGCYDQLDGTKDLTDGKFRVGLPWIGCGVGGLKRHNVEHMFRRFLSDSEVEFVLVEQPER
jgi:O-acetyl-ADP-ribose deacetylase (regulator of RNase III)